MFELINCVNYKIQHLAHLHTVNHVQRLLQSNTSTFVFNQHFKLFFKQLLEPVGLSSMSNISLGILFQVCII